MLFWNIFLLFQLILLIEGNPENACKTYGNELITDKVLKIQTPNGEVTAWNLDEVIRIQSSESGKLSFLLAKNTSMELESVDKSVMKVVLSEPFPAYDFNNVVMDYSAQSCMNETSFGVHYLHLNIVNHARNTTNEIVLKYEVFCVFKYDVPKSQDLNVAWKTDANCMKIDGSSKDQLFDAIVYTQVFSHSVMRSRSNIPSFDRGTIVFLLRAIGSFTHKIESNNQNIRVWGATNITNSNGYSFIFVEYETLAAGETEIQIKQTNSDSTTGTYNIPLKVVPGFMDFWKSSEYANINLKTGKWDVAKVFMWYPMKNKAVEFSETEYRFDVKRDVSEEYSELIILFTEGTEKNNIIFREYSELRNIGLDVTTVQHNMVYITFDGIQKQADTERINIWFDVGNKLIRTLNITTFDGMASGTAENEIKTELGDHMDEVKKSIDTSLDLYNGETEITQVLSYTIFENGTVLVESVKPTEVEFLVYRNASSKENGLAFVLKGAGNRFTVTVRSDATKDEIVQNAKELSNRLVIIPFTGDRLKSRIEHLEVTVKNEETGEKKRYSIEVKLELKSYIYVK